MDQITCPHCNKTFPMSDAITHELEEKVKSEQSAKIKAEFEEKLAKEREENEKKLREEFEAKSKESNKELEEMKRKERLLAEKLAQQEEEREKMEAKIKESARKEAEEESRLKFKEKDLQLEEIRRVNEDLKRKLEQGSQQLQGEALEVDLEEKLKATFPGDEFLPIPKGVEGADIWQKVRFNGKEVGSIIWETKRTKAWAAAWTTKLKEDSARVSATEAILATQVLPNGVSGFDRKDGVWVTTYENAIQICRLVRFLITSVNSAKSGVSHTDEEWGQIRDYIMSEAFKHRMQAHFDSVNALRTSLQADQRATTLRWKKQEDLIKKLDMNTINFYGELKSIVSNLPELDEIETPLIAESADESTNETLF